MSHPSVLIVGAVSDIGRAIARGYAAAGRPLVLAARDMQRLAADAADLRLRYGVAVTVFRFDVLDIASHTELLESIGDLPETVVSVVGMLGDQALSASSFVDAELVMRTNYLAPALFLGEIANRMEKRGRGTIVGISSVAGDRGRATNYTYGSAKAGFTAFLSGLRNRLFQSQVHVITVKPGFVDTKMTEGMKLPPFLTVQPQAVAAAVLNAEKKRKNVIYVSEKWRLIMAGIGCLPERVFKRMKL